MKFSSNDDSTVLTLTAYKADVEVHFYDGEVSHVDLDGHEFDPKSDILEGLHVMVFASKSFLDYETLTIQEIVRQARSQYSSIVREAEIEDRDNASMARELSSPYLTGRV